MELDWLRRVVLGVITVLSLLGSTTPIALGGEPEASESVSLAEESSSTVEAGVEGATTDEHPDQEESPSHDEPGHEGGQRAGFACVDLDPTFRQLAITGHPVSGNYTVSDGFRTVQFSVQDASSGGKVVNWQSDGPIDAVILRSGQDAAVYEYEPPTRSDTGLLPPLKDREGRNLAAVLACYDPADAVVGIELFLADSEDPVDVGSQFDYVLSINTNAPITDAEVTIALPAQVTAISAPDCLVEGASVRCAPPMDDEASWETTITVSADTGGNAVARATLRGWAGDEALEVSATEFTRIIAPPGHGGGCGKHEDEDECGDDGAGLVDACLAIDPDASVAILPGPFANRQYLVKGAGNARIWVTISEATGQQTASWESNIPLDAVFARTGRAIADYRYDFATFAGTGIVGPPGGSGQPRPMADLAFCYLVRSAVDVTLSDASVPRMVVGRSGVFQVTVTNHGYLDAEEVTIGLSMTENVALRSCDATPADGSSCRIRALATGSTAGLQFELAGISAGEAEVILDVQASNESADARTNNSMELSFIVEAEVVAQPPPSTPTDHVIAAQLPLTGPFIDTTLLALAGSVLVTAGALLVSIRLRRRRGLQGGC
ncbi:MAG TPA: hypothetical protein VF148_06385 [Acidimicrobiia bacterium]